MTKLISAKVHLRSLNILFAAAVILLPRVSLTAADEETVLTDMEQIMIAATTFREHAISDFGMAQKTFDRTKCLDIIRKSNSFKEVPAVWAYFFNSTLVLVGNPGGKRPIVGYYNPFHNAILLTQWEMTRGTPSMERADLRMASAFAKGKAGVPEDPVPWLSKSRKNLATKVLAAEADRVISAFEEQFPPDGTSTRRLRRQRGVKDVVDFVGSQSALILEHLAKAQSSGAEDFNPHLIRFVQRVRQGQADALNDMLRAAEGMDASLVLDIPQAVRARMAPVYVLSDNGGAIAIVSSAAHPRIYLFCAYTKADGYRLTAAGAGGFATGN